jgi:hypothetical protein
MLWFKYSKPNWIPVELQLVPEKDWFGILFHENSWHIPAFGNLDFNGLTPQHIIKLMSQCNRWRLGLGRGSNLHSEFTYYTELLLAKQSLITCRDTAQYGWDAILYSVDSGFVSQRGLTPTEARYHTRVNHIHQIASIYQNELIRMESLLNGETKAVTPPYHLLPLLYKLHQATYVRPIRSLIELITNYLLKHKNSASGKYLYGTHEFHRIWEYLVNFSFDATVPPSRELLIYGNSGQVEQTRRMYLDGIVTNSNESLIVDAKWYENWKTITTESIHKQFSYMESERLKHPLKTIKTTFVFPTTTNIHLGHIVNGNDIIQCEGLSFVDAVGSCLGTHSNFNSTSPVIL